MPYDAKTSHPVTMITTIAIKNFQSHKNSVLELCNGVNVIIGQSDMGKSAILRALYWLIFNKPNGNSFIRHNAKKPTSVTITGDFGEITRIKGGKENSYILNDQTYKAFGTGIPQPVFEALNMGELNFMRQLDPPFILSKSGSELASFLNRLINLEVIDNSLAKIKQSVTAVKRQADACEENIVRLIQSLDNYTDIDDMEKCVQNVEQLSAKINKKSATVNELIKQTLYFQDNQEQFGNMAWVAKADRQLQKVIAKISKLEQIQAERNSLSITLSALKKADMKYKSCFDTKPLETKLKGLLTDLSKIDKLENRITAINKHTDDYTNYSKIATDKQIELNKLENELKQTKPKTCPVCGQPWR